MKTVGFIFAWALAGFVFALISEFGQKKKLEDLKPVDGVISILRGLFAVATALVIALGYGRLMNYRPANLIMFIGFVVMSIPHLIYKYAIKKREP